MSELSRTGYDRLAPYYAVLEHLAFGAQLMRARTALLDHLPPLEEVLILGEGDGRFLEALLERQSHSRVTVLEQSPRMIELARKKLTEMQEAKVTFLAEDALAFTPEPCRYSGIVTAFFLDCFAEAELGSLIPRLATGLGPGGLWYYVDFQVPSGGWRKARAQAYLRLMHIFFHWRTGLVSRDLVDPAPIFARLGLKLLEHKSLDGGLLTVRLYQLESKPI